MATLNKFGVPLNGTKNGPMLQPKIKHRFRVRLFNFGSLGNTATPLTFNTNTITRPSFSHNIQEVHGYVSRQYYAGKHEWATVSLVVRDTVDNDVAFNVDTQTQRQIDHFNQTGYRSATSYKFTTFIETMDGGNDEVLDRWVLEGCFLSKVDYSDLDMSASEANTITMEIRYDNATHEDGFGIPLMTPPPADPLGTTL